MFWINSLKVCALGRFYHLFWKKSVLLFVTRFLNVYVYADNVYAQMKDTHLLPYILPNVFAISTAISPSQFASLVLPSLKPLFVVKEPPQNMMTLLDNLTMLQSKTDKIVFRERRSSHFRFIHFMLNWGLEFTEVLPLVYNALESDHAVVRFSFSGVDRIVGLRLV
jgi:hypothetical protein